MSNYDHTEEQEEEIEVSEEDDCCKELRNKSIAIHNRNEYPTLISTATRFGIGKRAVCALSNALLDDLGMRIPSRELRPSKISRMFDKYGRKLAGEENETISCLMFDGRKDETTCSTNTTENTFRGSTKEEHISLISEPGSVYQDHVTPKSGKACDIAFELYRFLKQRKSEHKIVVIGADGTNVNTGKNNGAIRLLELKLGRPLQWAICQLHLNELPFRHLFMYLGGGTSGPNSYKGPIGLAINNDLRQLPIVKLKKIKGRITKLPKEVVQNFTGDQRYFYDICLALRKGFPLSESIANRSPGKLCESRWLTKANRIMRLYVSTLNPTDSLRRLAFIVMYVYAPSWFHIKCHPKLQDAARNFHNLIKLSSILRLKEKCIVHRILSINSFSCHPESILLSIVSDINRSIRNSALKRILAIRKQSKKSSSPLRKFVRPTSISLNASEYFQMVDLKSMDVSEPPLTFAFTNNQIRSAVKTGEILNLGDFPNNTQAVERTVKLVTEASSKVIGYERRHYYILNALKSRAEANASL